MYPTIVNTYDNVQVFYLEIVYIFLFALFDSECYQLENNKIVILKDVVIALVAPMLLDYLHNFWEEWIQQGRQ